MVSPAPTSTTGGYERFYGFRSCPFDLQPDPQKVFESQAFQAALDAVVTAIRSNAALMAVHGRTGIGKTHLCRWLTAGLTGDVLLFPYAEPPSSSAAFLTGFAERLLMPARRPPSDAATRRRQRGG